MNLFCVERRNRRKSRKQKYQEKDLLWDLYKYPASTTPTLRSISGTAGPTSQPPCKNYLTPTGMRHQLPVSTISDTTCSWPPSDSNEPLVSKCMLPSIVHRYIKGSLLIYSHQGHPHISKSPQPCTTPCKGVESTPLAMGNTCHSAVKGWGWHPLLIVLRGGHGW